MSDFVTVQTPQGPVRFPTGMSRAEMAEALNSLPGANQEAPAEPKGFGQRLWENIVGDDDPTTQNTGEKIGSFLNKAGEAMTFGLVGDEASAAIAAAIPGGMDYDQRLAHERKQEEVFERDNPGAALGAEVLGGVLGVLLPGGQLGTLAKGASLSAKAAASGGVGAGLGGLYGFMEGEGEDRGNTALTGVAWGLGGGVAAPVAGAGVQKVANTLLQRGPRRAALKAAKTAADHRSAARNQYNIFENADVELQPSAVSRLTGNVRGRLAQEGQTSIPGAMGDLTPNASRIAGTMDTIDAEMADLIAQGQAPRVRLSNIEGVRRKAGDYAQEVGPNFRPTADANLAGRTVDEIDTFIEGLTDADVVGDVEAARSALKKARAAWRQSIKTQAVENAMDQAENYLGGAESGLRNQIGMLLRRNKKTKMFNDAEVQALRKILGNNMLSRSVRAIGDGLGRKAMMISGGAMGGLDGAAIGAGASQLAGQIGESAAVRNAEIARALISSGSLQNLPQSTDAVRRITEALTRRAGAVLPQ